MLTASSSGRLRERDYESVARSETEKEPFLQKSRPAKFVAAVHAEDPDSEFRLTVSNGAPASSGRGGSGGGGNLFGRIFTPEPGRQQRAAGAPGAAPHV